MRITYVNMALTWSRKMTSNNNTPQQEKGIPLGFLHRIYISDEIGSPENYIETFELLRSLTQNDVVIIHMNSHGGQVRTVVQFIRCMKECKAEIVCSVEGDCMSAATMIFLTADTHEIADHSLFMFHNYLGGTFGKGGEMYDQIQAEKSWSEKLLKDIYKDFLTVDEIDSIINSKDIWMTAEEVAIRLEKREQMAESD